MTKAKKTKRVEACIHIKTLSRRTVEYPTGPANEPWFSRATFECLLCEHCGKWMSLGTANDFPLAVTQELVALFYAEEPVALAFMVGEDEFIDGMNGKTPPEDRRRFIWETGALAAHLIEIGGQR